MFRSTHPVRNTLGAVAIGGTALLTGFSAAGQQVANLDAERNAYRAAQCGHITDAARRVGCDAEAILRFNEAGIAAAQKTIAANQKTIANAQELQRCIAYLGQKRESGTVFDRTITRENVCPYARELGMN